MRVLLTSGSTRPKRESHKPALLIKKRLEDAGHEVDFLDLLEADFPLFNGTEEQMESQPVRNLIASARAADGIVLVFPEYNHAVSVPTVNALSFLRKRELAHRPIGLVGVSDGRFGGVRALAAARASLPTMGGILMPTVVPVWEAPTTFPDENTVADARISASIDQMLKELTAYAPALKQVRESLAR